MKVFVMSDIHGNAPALREALRAYAASGATHIVVAGDLLGGRPFSRGTDEQTAAILLRAYTDRITAAKGNCDTAFDERRTGIRLAPYATVTVDGATFFVTHGHIYREGKLPDAARDAQYVVTGHTHIPSLSRAGNTVYLNPGSIACPRGGADRTYAIVSDNAVTIHRLPTGEVVQELEL